MCVCVARLCPLRAQLLTKRFPRRYFSCAFPQDGRLGIRSATEGRPPWTDQTTGETRTGAANAIVTETIATDKLNNF